MLELKRQTFRQNLRKSSAFTQVTLDDDCIVKDNKPDILKIIHTRGTVVFEDSKVSSQTVWVTGHLNFVVLYRSEDNRIESFTDSVNFGEKLFMEDLEESDSVRLKGKLEDLNISAINSRKVAVRALFGITAVCEKTVEEDVVSGLEADDTFQQKKETRQVLTLAASKRDILRIHNDITLPQSSPNIHTIIYENVDVRNLESACTTGQVQIRGEAHVSILYRSTEDQMEWYETMAPFSGSVDVEAGNGQPISEIFCNPGEYELVPAEDYDGEMRSLSLNQALDVDIRLWEEKDVEILSDVYSLSEKLNPQIKPISVWKLLVKNESKLRVAEQLSLEEGQERILQLCSCEGNVELDSVEQVENGLKVEGILTVNILYATSDDHSPIAHAGEQLPFTQIIDVPGMKEEMTGICCELQPGIDQLAVNLMDSGRFEVKAAVSVTAFVLKEEYLDKITEIREEPLDAVELLNQPGITGYIVKKEEQLWDIAKRFHTTAGEIMETNGLKSASLQQGDKLVIVKRVCES